MWLASVACIAAAGLVSPGEQPRDAAKDLMKTEAASLRVAWLRPDRFDAKAGERLSLSLMRGTGDGASAMNLEETASEWAFLRIRGVQENRDSLGQLSDAAPDAAEADAGKADAGKTEVTLARDGVAMIACDLAPRVETIDAGALRETLKDRLKPASYDELVAGIENKGGVRVRRVESAKCLVRVAKKDGTPGAADSQNVITKAGQRNEIRFTMDPTRAAVGSDVQFRVFAEYDKAAKAKVTVTCEEAGVSREIELDPSATGAIRLTDEGTWRVEFTAVKILKNDAEADVVVYVASAMFKTRAKEVGR